MISINIFSKTSLLPLFCAACLMTGNVHAQTVAATPRAGDTIQLNNNGANSDGNISVTGVISEADEDFLMIDSNGKKMKIMLSDVNLKQDTKTIFNKGMAVSVSGTSSGDDFGVPVIRASSVSATTPPPVAKTAPTEPQTIVK